MDRDRIVALLHQMAENWANHPVMKLDGVNWHMTIRATYVNKHDPSDCVTLVVGTEPIPSLAPADAD